MKTSKHVKIKLLQLAIDKYLWNGYSDTRDFLTKALCFAVSRADEELSKECAGCEMMQLYFARMDVKSDILQAINGRPYAETHLRIDLGWPEDTPKWKIQQWRRELAEKLIKQYEGEEE